MGMRTLGGVGSVLLLIGVGHAALGQAAPAKPGAGRATSATHPDEADRIWSYEEEIYRHRGSGDLSYYVSMADPDYTVWAPKWPKPNGYAELVKAANDLRGKTAGEVIIPRRKLIQINQAGDVALVYYSTHRTKSPGGKPADDRFDTLHVWVKGPGGWRLLGGMARPAR